ncbi:hypothetical protein [Celerinatantimonas yamalensis]|uniref:Uncharacterized protein n=1 Tax=Celerinatantimonas yamalensis TaxID=559956 RepID=A0ABW9G5Y1_9GAMM
MDPANISELMRASAADAVHFAEEQQITTLDYSISSLADVELLLIPLRSDSINDKMLFTLSYMFGAYMGEIFIQNYGGHWFHQEEQGGEPPQTFVIRDPYSYAFPGIVYQYLINNEQYSLVDYFQKIHQQYS